MFAFDIPPERQRRYREPPVTFALAVELLPDAAGASRCRPRLPATRGTSHAPPPRHPREAPGRPPPGIASAPALETRPICPPSHRTPPLAMAARRHHDSTAMRAVVSSSRSWGEMGATENPRCGSATANPSAARRESASRTAPRLTPAHRGAELVDAAAWSLERAGTRGSRHATARRHTGSGLRERVPMASDIENSFSHAKRILERTKIDLTGSK